VRFSSPIVSSSVHLAWNCFLIEMVLLSVIVKGSSQISILLVHTAIFFWLTALECYKIRYTFFVLRVLSEDHPLTRAVLQIMITSCMMCSPMCGLSAFLETKSTLTPSKSVFKIIN
jgi:hypothetical protein